MLRLSSQDENIILRSVKRKMLENRRQALFGSRTRGNTCLGRLQVIFFFDNDDGGTDLIMPCSNGKEQLCFENGVY